MTYQATPAFIRKLNQNTINNLMKITHPNLYDMLYADIKMGEVFPAIRNNEIDFYHGGRLFGFGSSGFDTHYKYIPGINNMNGNDYLSENKLSNYPRSATFIDGYSRIKELCKLYAGKEAVYVSRLYRNFNELFSPQSLTTVIPLDIEICFHSHNRGKGKLDKIDILFYNTVSKSLRFCEVKCFSDSRLYASNTNVPEVVNQMSRYEYQIINRPSEIIDAYKNHVDALNRLFNLQIPMPVKIDNKPIFLLITGFNQQQKTAVVTPMVYNFMSNYNIDCYTIGDTKNCKLKTMWDAI